MTAYCNACGAALPTPTRFCPSCGAAVAGFQPAGFPPPGYAPYAAPRLVRPLFGRQGAGVCAGFARTYGWDLGMVRVVTIITAIFLFPITEIAYLACWIGIPEEQPGEMVPPPPPQV